MGENGTTGSEQDGGITEVNIVVLGDAGVGKSCLIERLTEGTFNTTYLKTVGVDFNSRILRIDDTDVKLSIWDTSGESAFVWTAHKHLSVADGLVFCYDTTKETSFENIGKWLEISKRSVKSKDLPKLLLGTKMDMKHKKAVSASTAKEYGIPEGMEHIECSAQFLKNITLAFYRLTWLILKHRKLGCVTPLGTQYMSVTWREATETKTEKMVPNDQIEYTHQYKILMVGGTRTGKTALRFRFCRDYYNKEYHATAGLEYSVRTLMIDEEKVQLKICDVGGDSAYDMTRRGYYRGANAFIIVYDITNEASFTKAERLLKELSMYGQADCPKILVGNKTDLVEKRRVDDDTAKAFADGWRIPFVEVSARNGTKTDNAFLDIAVALKRQLAPWKKVYTFD